VGTDPRGRYAYGIEVPLEGSGTWFQLVIATTPEHAAEVVRILLACGGPEPCSVRVVKRPLD
jgi:hypothetical protein